MEFDEHDEGDEEMEVLPPVMRYEASPPPPAGAKLSGSGGAAAGGKSGSGGGKYRECLKNHAVGIGGHAVDGCGEFLPAGEEGTMEALRCAACNCHRNFHRKEPDFGETSATAPVTASGAYHPQFSPFYRTPAGYLHHHHHQMAAAAAAAAAAAHHRPPTLALPSTSGGHSRDEQEDISNPMTTSGGGVGIGSGGGSGGAAGTSSKKRFRTKFTQEQKDKMLAFAEHVGWRLQKHDEAAVQQFCNETGVKRHVLKVWMHNNKHTLGKKP